MTAAYAADNTTHMTAANRLMPRDGTQSPSMQMGCDKVTEYRKHYTDLDGMRGVLAIVVMLLHLGLNTIISKLSGGTIDHGAWVLCVDFFFILSGFVLAHSFQKGIPTFTDYVTKRARRLAPVFLFTTGAMFLLSPVATSGWTVVANLLMVQSLIGMTSINFPGWSIPFELFFPAVGLIAWPAILRTPRLGLGISLCAGAFAAVLLAMDIDVPMLRAASGLGAGFCLNVVKQQSSPVRARPFLMLVLFSLNILIMALAAKIPLLGVIFYPVSALSIIYGAQVRTILSTRPLQALGRWSYSVYLLHVPILTAANAVVGEHTMSGNITGKVVVIAVTLTAAGASYKFIEKPIMAQRRERQLADQTALARDTEKNIAA